MIIYEVVYIEHKLHPITTTEMQKNVYRTTKPPTRGLLPVYVVNQAYCHVECGDMSWNTGSWLKIYTHRARTPNIHAPRHDAKVHFPAIITESKPRTAHTCHPNKDFTPCNANYSKSMIHLASGLRWELSMSILYAFGAQPHTSFPH